MISQNNHKSAYTNRNYADYFSYFLDALCITNDELWETDGCQGWYWLDFCTNMQIEIESAAFVDQRNSSV